MTGLLNHIVSDKSYIYDKIDSILMLKKLLSYIFPIKHKVFKSEVSEQIELNWINGKLVIDTKRANYSYGNLQKILRKGLQKIGFENIKSMKNILILGLGGGSVAKTLVNEVGFNGKIIGVEYDPVMIGIGKKFFELDKLLHLDIQQADALSYIQQNTQTFDLIIVDIFQDIHMPDFVFSEDFTNELKNTMNTSGYLLFNTIVTTKESGKKVDLLEKAFTQNKLLTKRYNQIIGDHNSLLIIQKTI